MHLKILYIVVLLLCQQANMFCQQADQHGSQTTKTTSRMRVEPKRDYGSQFQVQPSPQVANNNNSLLDKELSDYQQLVNIKVALDNTIEGIDRVYKKYTECNCKLDASINNVFQQAIDAFETLKVQRNTIDPRLSRKNLESHFHIASESFKVIVEMKKLQDLQVAKQSKLSPRPNTVRLPSPSPAPGTIVRSFDGFETDLFARRN